MSTNARFPSLPLAPTADRSWCTAVVFSGSTRRFSENDLDVHKHTFSMLTYINYRMYLLAAAVYLFFLFFKGLQMTCYTYEYHVCFFVGV